MERALRECSRPVRVGKAPALGFYVGLECQTDAEFVPRAPTSNRNGLRVAREPRRLRQSVCCRAPFNCSAIRRSSPGFSASTW